MWKMDRHPNGGSGLLRSLLIATITYCLFDGKVAAEWIERIIIPYGERPVSTEKGEVVGLFRFLTSAMPDQTDYFVEEEAVKLFHRLTLIRNSSSTQQVLSSRNSSTNDDRIHKRNLVLARTMIRAFLSSISSKQRAMSEARRRPQVWMTCLPSSGFYNGKVQHKISMPRSRP